MSDYPYDTFMRAFRANMVRARDALNRLGYVFADTPLTDPSRNQRVLRQIEDNGLVVPTSIRAFYGALGHIEFTGSAPSSWIGCSHPDPISVVPLDATYWAGELDAWRERVAVGEAVSFDPQFSGDAIHKAGFSGGAYHFAFDGEEDAGVVGEDIPDRFTAYLRLCDTWGGFPGLRACPKHTWPLTEIRSGFEPLREELLS